jgi:hypothetical protein
MSDLGITTWAPPGRSVGFMQRSFEVHVDNIDADLFGNSIQGGMFQASNSGLYKVHPPPSRQPSQQTRLSSAHDSASSGFGMRRSGNNEKNGNKQTCSTKLSYLTVVFICKHLYHLKCHERCILGELCCSGAQCWEGVLNVLGNSLRGRRTD